jgi:hypothetical protein
MAGASTPIDNASATDTILSVKTRLFALNREMHVSRQRLVCTTGPFGMEPLADNVTLGAAGVAQDGGGKLEVLLADLTPWEEEELRERLGPRVWCCGMQLC